MGVHSSLKDRKLDRNNRCKKKRYSNQYIASLRKKEKKGMLSADEKDKLGEYRRLREMRKREILPWDKREEEECWL